MKKQHKLFPPLEGRHTIAWRKLLRVLINLFVLLGAGVIYYFIFSFLFDTPQEYELRKSTEGLRQEYKELSNRMDMIEEVMNNVVERDKNVFQIMFESDPYDLDEYSSTRWSNMEKMLSMNNREMGDYFMEETDELEWRLRRLYGSLEQIYADSRKLGESANNIPAIQPVLNKDLTLLTASFGMRIHPFYKNLSQHNGVDFTVPEGSRVFATADGVVKGATRLTSSSGLSVVIDHGDGYETRYSHLGESFVSSGQRVKRGDIIATTGNTGLSLAPHLHYEVHHNGKPADPVNYFFLELTPQEYRRIIRIAQSGMQSFD